MNTDAFVMRYQIEGAPFTAQFLASGDFDIDTLKTINRELDFPSNKPKNELIRQIAVLAGDGRQENVLKVVIEQLILKKKNWASVKIGDISQIPKFPNPYPLVYSVGKEGWYGPVLCKNDPPDTYWYIRQIHIIHVERAVDNEFHPYEIRWLVFARVKGNVLSLHWRGFTYSATEENALKHNLQFKYWNYIPGFFDEIQKQTKAKVEYANLHNLILQTWWDLYRDNQDYQWMDRRIRAESSGVSLNAHAGAVYDINAGGIKNLANTIRRSIEKELTDRFHSNLLEPDRFDEVILRTLIREYGTLSYEFSLDHGKEAVFRAHTYFGQKLLEDSPDKFPHLNFYTTYHPDLQQLEFLLGSLQDGRSPNANNQSEQLSLFR